MRRQPSLLAPLLLLAAASAPAVPIPCPTSTTLQVLMTTTPDGCFIQDKLFTAFAYSPGAADAALVQATLVFQVLPGSDVHGWTFARQGGWTSAFTLSYTVSVMSGNPGVAITASKDQIDTGPIPDGTAVTDTQTAATLVLSGAAAASEGAQAYYAGVVSVTTSSVVTIPAGSTLLDYSQLFYENTPDPEIPTLPASGLALLALVLAATGAGLLRVLAADRRPAGAVASTPRR